MTAKVSHGSTSVEDEVAGVGSEAPRRPPSWLRGSTRRAAQQVGPWQYGSLLGTKAFLLLIVAGVLAGPAALAWTLAAAGQAAPTTASSELVGGAGEDGRSRVEAVGAATNLVSLWLSAGQADSETLAALVANPPAQLSLPRQRPAPPTMVAVLDAVQASPTVWDVLVAARGGQAGAGALYRVAVSTTDRGGSALTMPGQVPMPTGPAGSVTADVEVIASSHPAAETVNGFARALLSNSGDLSRWLAPGSALTPVTPKVCQQVQTTVSSPTDLPDVPGNGEEASVLTDLTCQTSGNTGRTFQYMLTLRGRDGRWEVASYTSAVTTAAPAASSSTSPAATSTGSTSAAPTPGR